MKSALLTLVLLLAGVAAQAGPNWRTKYRTLHSAHFEVIYRQEQKNLAKRYLLAAEQAHEVLLPLFKEGPSKTIIFLRDDTDVSNGLATFLPYPMIEILPVLPSTLDTIDDFGDWPFELLLHEYAHILNMYPANGFYRPLSWIFGSVVRPNAILPRWYLEGLAVELETLNSTHGRLRSSETAAMARALTQSGRLKAETLPRINETGINTWPYGGRPYLYGGWWWQTVTGDRGTAIIDTWNRRFSRRIPFLLNAPMRDESGKTPAEWLEVSLTRVESLARAQLEAIEKAGVPAAQEVARDEAGEQAVFAVSPSGDRLVYWTGRPRQGQEVRVKTRAAKNQPWSEVEGIALFKTEGALSVRWLDDSRFVFDQIDLSRPGVNYRDLYMYDLGSGETKRLTVMARAQQASPSASGEKLTFIQNEGGRTHLSVMDLKTGERRTILNGSLNDRFSTPEFHGENEVLFNWRKRSGEEKLFSVNLQTKKAAPLPAGLTASQNLRRIGGGYLVADAGLGARNIFWLATPSATPVAVSNSLTEIETADFDPQRNEVLVSEMTVDGRRLRALEGGLAARTLPNLQGAPWPAPLKATTTDVKFRDESYQPVRHLFPRYWIPFIYPVEDGFLIQGTTEPSDPAGRNRYSLLGSYDSVTQKSGYGISYVNSSLPTDIGLSYSKAQTYLGASGTTLETQYGSVNFSNYWPFNNRKTRWNLGGVWEQTLTSVPLRQLGPSLGFSLSNLHHPLNTWFGWHAEASHSQYLPQAGYLDYGRSYAHLATVFHVGRGRQILFQSRAALAPKMPFRNIVSVGDRNVGGNYLVNLANSQFLLRGYPSGTLVGRKILNANLEYSFPLFSVERGAGTFPVFVYNLQGAVFTDIMAVDGAAFENEREIYVRRSLSQGFLGTGAELRLNTTTAYQLPLSFILGAYYGANERFGGGFTPFFGVGLGDYTSIENKTP